MCRESIISIISVGLFRTNNKEITDGWMMRYLLAVDFSSIWVEALKSLTDDWIKLKISEQVTGFKNKLR